MNSKVKGGLSIFFLSVTFFMTIKTKYCHALGDYVLEFIGIKSWSSDYSGTHLTVIYFLILFIVGLFLIKKYAIDGLNIRRRNVFIIFLVLVTVFTSVTSITAKIIKKNSLGLLSIGYNSKGTMNYKYENSKFVEFSAEFELTNYSNKKETFYISIDSPFYRKDGTEAISFYTFDGKQAIFELESKETKSFSLNLGDYNVVGGRRVENGSGSGIVKEITLINDEGQKVRLDNDNFLGIELNK